MVKVATPKSKREKSKDKKKKSRSPKKEDPLITLKRVEEITK